jgi:hypothetical protein
MRSAVSSLIVKFLPPASPEGEADGGQAKMAKEFG